MNDAEVKTKVQETLDRAKHRRLALIREIRNLETAIAREDGLILSCLTILDEIEEKEAE